MGPSGFSDPGYGIMSNYEGHKAAFELPANVYRLLSNYLGRAWRIDALPRQDEGLAGFAGLSPERFGVPLPGLSEKALRLKEHTMCRAVL